MKMAKLGDICQFVYGKGLPNSQRVPGEYPVFGSNGSVGMHEVPLSSSPAIIVGRKGSIGEVNYSDKPCWPIDTTYYIDENSTSEDIRWLFYALKSLRLPELNKATGVPGLNRNDAYEKVLLVPDRQEQRRIAAILDKAGDIVRKNEEVLDLAAGLLKSAYVHMVGYMHPDYASWVPHRIEQLAADRKGSMRTGPFGSALRHGEFVEHGIAVLGIDNAVKNRFEWGERRFITAAKYAEMKRYRVFPGDVIVTIMGTTGRSAVVPDDIPEAITTKHLATITCDRREILPECLSFAIHSDPLVIRQIHQANKGAIMDGLNLGIIKNLEIKLPPLAAQAEFVRLLKTTRRLNEKVGSDLGGGNDLFASLTQRAFRGEL